MIIASTILGAIGSFLLISAGIMILKAFGGPASTGNGAGAMAGLILFGLSIVAGAIGSLSLIASGIILLFA